MTDKIMIDIPPPPPIPSLLSRIWYESGVFLGGLYFTLANSMRVKGLENVPMKGPLLVLANHQSFYDPYAIGVAVRRHLVFLARKTLFRNPLFRKLILSLNAVPIDQQGVGKEGLKVVVEQLKQQKAVLVFPEGERTWNGKMLPLRPGIHLLMRLVESTILPVGIAGAFEAYPRTQLIPHMAPLFMPAGPGTMAVCIGKPLSSCQFAGMSRAQVLPRLFEEIHTVQQQAEALRRK